MFAYCVAGSLGLLVLIVILRAAFMRQKPVQAVSLPKEKVNAGRAAEHLSKAIQIPTISYPDESQMDFAQFTAFQEFLEQAYPLIHRHLKREKVSAASLLFRWEGQDATLEPIALLSHQDVVPVEEGTQEDWTHPPFSGHNDGTFLWGRGSMDMKNHLICVMEAVETLLEEGYRPKRDVYLCFGHDEEVVGGEISGAKDIVTLLQSRGVKLDSVLDEGGPFLPIQIKGLLDKHIVAVGISEKGYADYEICIRAKGGHSSAPPDHSALGELAKAIRELENNQFRAKFLPYLHRLLNGVGRGMAFPGRVPLCNLWLFRPLIRYVMKKIPPAASLVRTTTAVTMAQGSPACNVLPQTASATVNFRMMPGDSLQDVEKHIRRVTSNKKLEIRYLKGKEASPFSPTDSRAYKTIERLAFAQQPGSLMAPFLVMGGTDACFYEPICANVYRFSPFCVTPDLLTRAHTTDERIPVTALEGAVTFFKRYIKELT